MIWFNKFNIHDTKTKTKTRCIVSFELTFTSLLYLVITLCLISFDFAFVVADVVLVLVLMFQQIKRSHNGKIGLTYRIRRYYCWTLFKDLFKLNNFINQYLSMMFSLFCSVTHGLFQFQKAFVCSIAAMIAITHMYTFIRTLFRIFLQNALYFWGKYKHIVVHPLFC